MFPCDLKYLWEKAYQALLGLVQAEGTLNQRLANAYGAFRGKTSPCTPDVPEELAQEWAALLDRLTELESQPRGFLGLDEQEARELADRLIQFYGDVCRVQGPQE